jgi:murein DD-endopeptidase MepM/ murein hydrolase activator NlpD
MIVMKAMTSRLIVVALVMAAACTQPPLPTLVPVPLDPPPSAPTATATPPANTGAPAAKPVTAPVTAPTTARSSALALSPKVSEDDILALRQARLIIPVAGIAPQKLEDSFNEPRDGDRKHNAIDILAPRGTPILSADDGRILRMSNTELGGI